MKARLPQGFSNGGGTNLQQLARQAQKLQEEMDAANSELEQKEYSATVGGNAVTAVVTGKMEVKSLDIKPEVVDPEDIDMLSELVIAAVNEAVADVEQLVAQDEEVDHYLWHLIMSLLWLDWWSSLKACRESVINQPSVWLIMFWVCRRKRQSNLQIQYWRLEMPFIIVTYAVI